MIYLSFDEVIEMHDALLEKSGGMAGIRDVGLLESALAGPWTAVFGEELHKTVFDKAAAYLFYLSKNHPFFDGNKRTATAVTLVFLRINSENPKYHLHDLVEFVVLVAEGKHNISIISKYLKNICSD